MILLFLLHIRSSLIVATTLPVAVLLSFVAMKTLGVDANIMSLAGIAIAIGTMVDMGIIVSENIYQHLADWEKEGLRQEALPDVVTGHRGRCYRGRPCGRHRSHDDYCELFTSLLSHWA